MQQHGGTRAHARRRRCVAALALALTAIAAPSAQAAQTLVVTKGDFDLTLQPTLREALQAAEVQFSEREPVTGGNINWFFRRATGEVSSSLKRLSLRVKGGMVLRNAKGTVALQEFRLQHTDAGRSVSVLAGGERRVLATFPRTAGKAFFIGNQREFALDYKGGRLTAEGAELLNTGLGTTLTAGTLAFVAHGNADLCPKGQTCKPGPVGGGN